MDITHVTLASLHPCLFREKAGGGTFLSPATPRRIFWCPLGIFLFPSRKRGIFPPESFSFYTLLKSYKSDKRDRVGASISSSVTLGLSCHAWEGRE
jgi:hypothetical protein